VCSSDLSWVDANRSGTAYSNARYQVWLDGVWLGTYDTRIGEGWNAHNLSFVTTAGLHTLRWQGVAVATDATAFIDNLSVTAVPEPSTALMGLAGLGLLGGISRRRRRA
jgi:MYXO-CTERM domain-containing protein